MDARIIDLSENDQVGNRIGDMSQYDTVFVVLPI